MFPWLTLLYTYHEINHKFIYLFIYPVVWFIYWFSVYFLFMHLYVWLIPEILISKHFFKDFIFLFLERGEGKVIESKRNINVWLPLKHPQLGAPPGPQPTHEPWPGIEPATLLFSSQHSVHWATPAFYSVSYFASKMVYYILSPSNFIMSCELSRTDIIIFYFHKSENGLSGISGIPTQDYNTGF